MCHGCLQLGTDYWFYRSSPNCKNASMLMCSTNHRWSLNTWSWSRINWSVWAASWVENQDGCSSAEGAVFNKTNNDPHKDSQRYLTTRSLHRRARGATRGSSQSFCWIQQVHTVENVGKFQESFELRVCVCVWCDQSGSKWYENKIALRKKSASEQEWRRDLIPSSSSSE